MEGYNSIAMHSYSMAGAVAPPTDILGLPSPMLGNSGMLPLDALDHHSNYDADTFAGSEEATSLYGQPLHLQPPTSAGIKQFPSGSYEDAFSDVLSSFDPAVSNDTNAPHTPSIEHDHKLLSFSPPTLIHAICDYGYRPATISLAAQLHGMFFLAESAFPAPGDTAAPQTELTCYRRNLFQITGNLVVPRGLRYVLTEQGDQIPIVSQELTVSATETVEGNAVKIICVPWKTPVTSAPSTDDKSEKEPTSIPIDLNNSDLDLDPDFVNCPIAWKRLQFRIATANNGRRKELQQHFIVRLKVMATLANGACVNICEVRSNAIIVRGRSPRNFQSRKDLPISGSGAFGRRTREPPTISRTPTGDTTPPRAKAAERSPPQNLDIPKIPFTFSANDYRLSPEISFDWTRNTTQPGVALTALPSAFPVQEVGIVNTYAHSTPDLTGAVSTPQVSSRAPINLSLSEDNIRGGGIKSFTTTTTTTNDPKRRKTASTSPVSNPAKRAKTHRAYPRPPSFSLGPVSTTDESADILYEYFPLGLDDWMPPVDAVYRPHVVHHTNLPADPKAMKNRSKRYFSEDQAV